jgi:uncharacterized protein (TIGR01777 family)
MKIIIPGGNGHLGQLLVRAFRQPEDECVILSRTGAPPVPPTPGVRHVAWDGRTLGPWSAELDGADVVINLAGRSVNCRYHERNLAAMMASRVESTRVIGEAIAAAQRPPPLWLQASSSTIYTHRYDAPNDEATGLIGGSEPGVPRLWQRSVEIIQAWEGALAAAPTPLTRRVALRISMVMERSPDGVFAILARHCRMGFGRFADGRHYVSWLHEEDFVGSVRFLISREDLSGAFNLCAPEPLPNDEFLAILRRQLGRRLAIPVPAWALEIGTFFLRTETELILKSRRVVPTRLLEAGYRFRHPTWAGAAADLVNRRG